MGDGGPLAGEGAGGVEKGVSGEGEEEEGWGRRGEVDRANTRKETHGKAGA